VASSKPLKNALNHAWRDAAVHVIVKMSWTANLTQDHVDILHKDATNRIEHAMRQLSPDYGCCVNEIRLWPPILLSSMPGSNMRYSVISSSRTDSGLCTARITLAFVLSRGITIPMMYVGTEDASEARIGCTLRIAAAFVTDQLKIYGLTVHTSEFYMQHLSCA
jgi:hypothetical protein